jgi:hypothetical protein
MSMLHMSGQVINVFDVPEGVSKKTGEAYGGQFKIQLMAENELQNGQKRVELVDLTVDQPSLYKPLVGQRVRVPVGAFVNGTKVQFFALKGARPEKFEVAT